MTRRHKYSEIASTVRCYYYFYRFISLSSASGFKSSLSKGRAYFAFLTTVLTLKYINMHWRYHVLPHIPVKILNFHVRFCELPFENLILCTAFIAYLIRFTANLSWKSIHIHYNCKETVSAMSNILYFTFYEICWFICRLVRWNQDLNHSWVWWRVKFVQTLTFLIADGALVQRLSHFHFIGWGSTEEQK